jgi:hypothetical protein
MLSTKAAPRVRMDSPDTRSTSKAPHLQVPLIATYGGLRHYYDICLCVLIYLYCDVERKVDRAKWEDVCTASSQPATVRLIRVGRSLI